MTLPLSHLKVLDVSQVMAGPFCCMLLGDMGADEMSSINPIFLLPAALCARAEAIAAGYVDSLLLGVGQFCTNPGLVVGVAGPGWDRFVAAVSALLPQRAAGTMLNAGIHAAYGENIARLARASSVQVVATGKPADAPHAAVAWVHQATASDFMAQSALHDEVFGPSGLLVSCQDTAELRAVAERLEGQLTATLQMDDEDLAVARQLLPTLERKAGRILANSFPTGVEVSYAMVHGGPFPASSDSRSTSVGARAIERFLRPVCYQGLPAALLPESLQARVAPGAWRLVDGAWRCGSA